MNKPSRIAVFISFILALLLAVFLLLRYTGLHRELNQVNQELIQSMDAWQRTAAMKEELQKELKDVQESLKDARMTLEESTERSAQLKDDIVGLEATVETLRQQFDQSSD